MSVVGMGYPVRFVFCVPRDEMSMIKVKEGDRSRFLALLSMQDIPDFAPATAMAGEHVVPSCLFETRLSQSLVVIFLEWF